ncbi:Uncharacterised protein [Enterobacter hormaechei]|nr:Uncharacterised protein [Enterobacter hormaechei]
MYNGIVVRASSLVVITDEGLLRLIDSDCTHWAKGNKMTASRITHLIRGPLGKRKLSYYKGFPEQSTPVFNFCLFINERQGIRLRYYKRSC